MFTTISELPTDYEHIESLPELSPPHINTLASAAPHPHSNPAPPFKTSPLPKLSPLRKLSPIAKPPSED